MARKNRLFAKLASDVDTSGNLAASGIQSEALDIGVTVYASRANLPSSGNTAGDQAYVTDNNRLYIWNGSGWYSIALINQAPNITSVLDSDSGTTPFTLSSAGAVTRITITAVDSDGESLTYAASSDSDFSGLGTLSQADNVFTITPFGRDSATTTSGTITFTATDGVNVASSGIQTFTLNFLSPYWDETVLSIGTSSTNSLDNDTFIDRSSYAHSSTNTGTGMGQTAFHPYLDNWSVEFDGTNDNLSISNTTLNFSGDFTVEFWTLANSTDNLHSILSSGTASWGSGACVILGGGSGANEGMRLAQYPNEIVRDPNGIEPGVWYHYAFVRSGTTVTLYRNGTSVATGTNTDTITLANNSSTKIGGGNWDGANSYWDGYISNLRIVNGTAVYTSAFTPSTQNLTAITNTVLLTCQNNRFIDNSNSAFTLTTGDTPKVSAFNPFGQGSEYATGANKGGCVFNATGNHIDYASDASFAFGTGDYTVEWWHWQTAQQWGTVFDTSDVSNYLDTLFIATSGTAGQSIRAYHSGGARAIGSNGGDFPLYQWTHCAVTRESGVVKIYINGKLDGQGSGQEDLTQYGATVGRATFWNNSYSLRNDTIISDLKVTKGTAVYTTSGSPGTQVFTPRTAPVGNTNASLYLPFDNAGIYDKIGNHTLTLSGDTKTSTTQTKYATTSMYFDGTGDYITFDPINLLNGDFTIEGWVYPTASGSANADAILFIGNANVLTGDDVQLGIYINSSNGFILRPYSGTTDYGMVSSAQSLNTWHHLAITRSGNSFKGFVNGTQVGTTQTISGSLNAATNYQIGLWTLNGSPIYYTGYLENFQILKGIAKYTSNFTPPTQTQGRQYQAES